MRDIKIYYEHFIAKYLFSATHTIMLFGMVFTRKKEERFTEKDKTHEFIHVKQWQEITLLSFFLLLLISLLLIIFNGFIWIYPCLLFLAPIIYYIFYFIEWFYQFIWSLFNKNIKPYHIITLEQEAYENDDNGNYPNQRKHFAWFKYLGKITVY